MSSITITGAPAHRAPRSTRLRLTVRGRRVLLALAAAPFAIAVVMAGFTGLAANATADDVAAVSFERVVVLPGDTLWSIATEIAPGADPREVIDDIQRLNLLQGGQIIVGQQLAIPAKYSAVD